MEKKYLPQVLAVTLFCFMIAIPTADDLSGLFFKSTFYANDYLGWGIILFAGLGFLIGNLKIGFAKNTRSRLVVDFIAVLVLGILLFALGLNLQHSANKDYEILGKLLHIWSIAFILNGVVVQLGNLARPDLETVDN